jgi:hypothetical protein
MRSIICAALSVGIVVAGSSGAFAQREGVQVYPGEQESTRDYRYRSDEGRPDVVIPIRPASCGEFRYWDGKRCADAREVPPDVR